MTERQAIKMKFRVKKDIYWDNWGRIVQVATKGQIVNGELLLPFDPERPWEYSAIESPFYPGIEDFASADEVKPICKLCQKSLTTENSTAIFGTCDDCLADEAAEYNNSYHSYEY